MASTYSKPFLTVDEQLKQLIARGMSVENPDEAILKLQAIGYYRLSGYWYPFRVKPTADHQPRPSHFLPDTTLDEVLEIYYFDERLRVELLRALGRIEVSLRFWVGHRLGKRGPFAHTDLEQLDFGTTANPQESDTSSTSHQKHAEWVEKQKRAEAISNEAFVAHIYNSYGEPLPIWTATETITFETLNRLYAGMMQQDRDQIAVEFDLFREDGNGDSHTFSNWIEHLRQTRNFCAPHARLWNRNHTAPLAIPESAEELTHLLVHDEGTQRTRPVTRTTSRIYGTLALTTYLLARIDHSNVMRDCLISLVLEFAEDRPDRFYSMGFPEGWEKQDLWTDGYARDPERITQARMLRDVELLYTKDAAANLTIKPNESARRSLLNYYRKHGALLSVPGATAHRYPAFQFNKVTGDVNELVIVANRRLMNRGTTSEETRWEALRWWVSTVKIQDERVSRIEALLLGRLTREMLDEMLTPLGDE